jgi:hypothetical protein
VFFVDMVGVPFGLGVTGPFPSDTAGIERLTLVKPELTAVKPPEFTAVKPEAGLGVLEADVSAMETSRSEPLV